MTSPGGPPAFHLKTFIAAGFTAAPEACGYKNLNDLTHYLS
jgi:hypothetical protein